MQFSFTDEQEQFRTVIARFMRDNSATNQVRELMATETGYDAAVWRALADELGATGLHLPEAYGGQGFGFVELGMVMEEMGRSLFCSPFFASSVLAAEAILQAGSEADKQEWLPPIAAGAKIAALAVTEANGLWGADGVETTADGDGASVVLNGSKKYVVDGAHADTLVVVARAPGTTGTQGLVFALLDGSATGVTRRRLNGVDETRPLAQIDFSGATAHRLTGPDAAGALTATLQRGAVALANEMVGGAQQLLDSAVEYSRLRMQFGRRIGSFQAIKHKCADLLLNVEMAKSAAYQAAQAIAEGDADAAQIAAIAKATASETYMDTAAQCIQIHGGIGFTWDNDTHLWYKRAKASEVMFGDAAYHREQLLVAANV